MHDIGKPDYFFLNTSDHNCFKMPTDHINIPDSL